MKYLRSATLGYKDIEIRKSEFRAKTQLLKENIFLPKFNSIRLAQHFYSKRLYQGSSYNLFNYEILILDITELLDF